MPVPFFDMTFMHMPLEDELKAGFNEISTSGRFILGKYGIEFEQAFAAYTCCSYSAGTGNGLDALTIGLQALGIGAGDEVIVPANTFIATWLAVSRTGALPIPVEPRPDTYNINPELVAEKLSPRTKAIVPVHLYGQSAEMDALLSIAALYGLHIVEDFAQAQGATWNGRPCGSMGAINATSFYPGKNIGAFGDAGAITTSSGELYNQAILLRNYGSIEKYYHEQVGYNSRLDELQAMVLQIKLPHLDKWNAERIAIANAYAAALKGVGDLILPVLATGATSVYHQFVIRSNRRNALQKFLSDNGIQTIIHYPVPPHLQGAYRHLNYKKGDLPITEQIAESILSLPIYPGLSKDRINEVCEVVKAFFR